MQDDQLAPRSLSPLQLIASVQRRLAAETDNIEEADFRADIAERIDRLVDQDSSLTAATRATDRVGNSCRPGRHRMRKAQRPECSQQS